MSTPQRYDTQNACASPTTALPAVHQAISLDSPPTVRQYFEKVRELVKSGVQFPVQLDEVWHLAYGRKEEAVRVLKADFMQHLDYQSLRKSPEKYKGRQIEVYSLSASCVEWLIARKVREVFEVYREVFHRVVDLAEQAIHQPQAGLIKVINELTEKVIGLEREMGRMHKTQEKWFQAKVVSQQDQAAIDLKCRRDKIMGMMSIMIRRSPGFSWKGFWDVFAQTYLIEVRELPHKPGEHFLDVAIRHGHIERVWEMMNWQ